jgi:hypothetical protein
VGQKVVSPFIDRDTVYLAGHRGDRQIMICVYRAPVRFYDLDVRFSNGGHQDLNVRHLIRPGQCTRAIDLRGFRRDIRYVTMLYESERHGRLHGAWHGGFPGHTNFGPQALVRVFAR